MRKINGYHIPGLLVVMGLIIAIGGNVPAYAGEAAMLMSVDKDAPEGSFIPDRRVKKIEKKVTEFKAKLRQEAMEKQKKQSPEAEPAKPATPEKK